MQSRQLFRDQGTDSVKIMACVISFKLLGNRRAEISKRTLVSMTQAFSDLGDQEQNLSHSLLFSFTAFLTH